MRKKEKLTHRIHTRITEEKYNELSRLLEQTQGIQTHSELLRNILENRKIITETYDRSLDLLMQELSAIRKELHAIGININQVTRRFHLESRLEHAMEIARLYRQTEGKVARLFYLIEKLSEKWLPGS